ncbi:MAG: RICIN domain-containing protein [Kineosporiaceae bacterium]
MTRSRPSAVNRRLAGAPMPAREEGIAIFFVLLCILILSALSIGLLGALFSEFGPTVYERKSERTIAGAQAGLQAGLAAVRQAWTTTSGTTLNGDPTKLPCYTTASPLVGQVGGLDSTQQPVSYSVQVSYFTVSPSGQTAAWRAANALPCVSGAGTATTPVYALIQAAGSSNVAAVPGGWGNRSSEVVYALNRTDQSVLGGPIHSDLIATTTKNFCWQAASYPASVGTQMRLATCVAGDLSQTWSYRTDYSIVLSGSQASTSPPSGGLCIATITNGSGSITGASLQTCVSGSWKQLWAYDDAGQFQGVNSTKTSLSGKCLTTNNSYAVGAVLTIANCNYPVDNWTPDATVGAGAAGAATQQLINYGEYGRCLDITNWNLSATWLIDYPCKQDPTSTVGWNQRWVWDSPNTREIQSNTSSGLYCLTTPASAGAYVVVRPCDSTRNDQKWMMLGDTGNRSTSYTIIDSYGRCLSLGPAGPGRPDLSSWSSITSDVCDGSFEQKWNAPPLPAGANLAGERETTNGK